MLKTTIELIDHLNQDNHSVNFTIINSLVNAILKCGNKEDADLILNQYLKNPFDFNHSVLLPVLTKFGDEHYAELVFQSFIKENKLIENADPAILEVIGNLQYDPVKPVLAEYVFDKPGADYYLSKSAVLGLLNFDCDEYQNEIESAIENCYNKNLFPEFVPALVCKLKNQPLVLEKLYELGSQYASTDCNAGIILGFSLSGEEGRKYFKRVLFDPLWETYSTSTGTIHFAYQGMKNAGINFNELYHEIKQISDKDQLAYSLDVLFALIERRIGDAEINLTESFSDIYSLLFKWENAKESNNLTALAAQVNKSEEAFQIERIIELKMHEEAILKNYIS